MMRLVPVLMVAVALTLGACGKPSKHEIIKKAETIETKAELEKALGAPDDISKVGPIETWTYQAENGTVTFVITGDSVTLRTAGDGGGSAK